MVMCNDNSVGFSLLMLTEVFEKATGIPLIMFGKNDF